MAWKVLTMICPGAWQKMSCAGTNDSIGWVCVSHKKKLFIDERGYIACNDDNECNRSITAWSFACHNHPGEFVSFNNRREYKQSLSTMLLYMDDDDFAWYTSLKKIINAL